MTHFPMVKLEELIAKRLGSVNPEKFPEEVFELYSIPAFDIRCPDVVTGAEIGSSKQLIQPHDVLLSKIVPHIRRSWVVGSESGHRLIGSGEWIVFRSDKVHPPYLRQVLVGDQFHAQFMQTVSGVGGSLLRARPAQVAKIEVPLPSLPEQRRIAAILDKADTLRAKRREALAQLDRLAQSIFLECFSESLKNQERLPLSTAIQEFRYGTSNKSGNDGFPALRIPNVAGGALNLTEVKTVKVDAAELSRLRLQDGDVLFVRTNGNQEYVGRCAVFEESAVAETGWDTSAFIFASYLIRARLDSNRLLPVVLQAYLSSPEGRRELLSNSKTSAGQFNINTEGLGGLRVPIFPMSLQKTFVRRLTVVKQWQQLHSLQLAEMNKLFSSLQQEAFSGHL